MYELEDDYFAASLHNVSCVLGAVSGPVPLLHINRAFAGRELLIPTAVMMTLLHVIPFFPLLFFFFFTSLPPN